MSKAPSQPSSPAGREYADSIGAFFLLDKKGKLLALRSVVISDDGAAFRPTAIPTDLTAMYPLVSAIEASSISLSVTYGPSPHSHFVMQVNIAGQKKTIRAPGGTLDILTEALENDTFPIVAQTDLGKAVHASRQGSELIIPIRMLKLRQSVPMELSARLKDIFINNATSGADKASILPRALIELRWCSPRDTAFRFPHALHVAGKGLGPARTADN